MILGVITIAVALFSGFPSSWNTVLYVILGLLVIITAYLMKPASVPAKPAAPYVEHTPTPLADTNTPPLP
jgi:hypothetical protein